MNTATFNTRIKCAIVMILFMTLSIGPVPLTSTIGLYIVIFRPRWFKELVERIYSE